MTDKLKEKETSEKQNKTQLNKNIYFPAKMLRVFNFSEGCDIQ